MNLGEDFVYGTPRVPAFEGASTSYLYEQYEVASGDADAIAVNERELLIARARHLTRNNAVAATARNRYTTQLGHVLVKWNKPDGSPHDLMQELWDEWKQCCNVDGFGDFNTLQTLWHSERLEGGEALTRMLVKKNQSRIPLQLQTIETEYLDMRYRGANPLADSIRYGIKFDKYNKPIGYYFHPELSFSITPPTSINTSNQNHVLIDAKDIIHVFERLRPNQTRGVPTFSSCILPAYQVDDLSKATVAKALAATAVSWLITQQAGISQVPIAVPTMGGTRDKEDPEKKLYFKANSSNVQYLNKGEDIKFFQPDGVGEGLGKLMEFELSKIAAALDIPYYQLTGDASGLNFSSIRALLIMLRTRIDYLHTVVTIPQGLTPLTIRFKALAELQFAVKDAIPSYQMPRTYGVDDLKDAQADLLEIQSGFATLQSKLAERNMTIEQIVADREKAERLGLGDIFTATSSTTAQSSNITANSNSTSL